MPYHVEYHSGLLASSYSSVKASNGSCDYDVSKVQDADLEDDMGCTWLPQKWKCSSHTMIDALLFFHPSQRLLVIAIS